MLKFLFIRRSCIGFSEDLKPKKVRGQEGSDFDKKSAHPREFMSFGDRRGRRYLLFHGEIGGYFKNNVVPMGEAGGDPELNAIEALMRVG